MAQAITDALNEQAQGLCKEVRIKSGRFNQHVADCCILVEAGNNRNTLAEVLAAMTEELRRMIPANLILQTRVGRSETVPVFAGAVLQVTAIHDIR
jgi:hypothetical protein